MSGEGKLHRRLTKLTGRTAIVTGGGRGIGKAIALAFAQEGANLVLVSRTTSELEEAAAQIRQASETPAPGSPEALIRGMGGKVMIHPGDAAQDKTAHDAVRVARETFGDVDILVNAAGINGPIGPVEEADTDEWRRTIEINLTSAFLFIKAVLPGMKLKQRGKIINISGGGAANPRPKFAAYAVSKAGLVRLTETVAEEVKEFNIQVNALAPGAVNTRMFEEMLAAGAKVGEAEYASLREREKTGGAPAEKAAGLAVFLASEESNDITGRMISAMWDGWNGWGADDIRRIQSSELYTLRRLTPKSSKNLS